jgi:glycosyltransferase involved in cell wall biosynthesis
MHPPREMKFGPIPRFVAAQPIPRSAFIFPRAIYAQGMLAALVTGYIPPFGKGVTPLLRATQLPGLARASSLFPQDIPRDLLISGGISELIRLLKFKLRTGRVVRPRLLMEFERDFAEWVSRLDLPEHTAFIGFAYSSLEIMAKEREAGRFVVVVQIDAAALNQRIVQQEAERWPSYVCPELVFPEAYFDRVRREWALADLILVNSDWTRRMLISEGVSEAKIELIPLAYSRPASKVADRRDAGAELSVVWLGNVTLGKGIQYLVEAARLLMGEPVRFTIAGQICVAREAIHRAPSNMTFLGAIPFSKITGFLSQGDVFVFPTLSDGFGLTQIQAIAHGLPVITTPNCGTVVEHGVTGYIVEPRSPEALAQAILQLSRNRELLRKMAAQCLCAANRFSPAVFAERLGKILGERFRATADR